MTLTTDALIPALEDVREAHAAVVDRFRADMAVTPAGPHRQTLERHAAQTRHHIARIDTHVRDMRPRHLIRDTGDMVRTASAGAFHTAMAPLHIGARMVRGILPGGAHADERQLLRNTEDEYTATARALAACRAGESIATLAQDDRAAALLSTLRRQDEQLLRELESSVEDQALALATTAAGDGHHPHGAAGIADVAVRTLRATAQRLQAVWTGGGQGGQSTARPAGDAERPAAKAPRAHAPMARTVDLPLADYDRLPVAEIIQRLRLFSQADLSMIEDYEREHGDRVGILNAIENLRGNQPWPGYDTMSPDQITARLRGAEPLLARQAMDYERQHRGRPDVISAAKQRTRAAV
ncbi:hypothetical protein [Actinacidiphila glaucinigra]|uniref:hypothetical protein n=1 Tax=Actinacidiphila glaucinigra TaxID=235986 RepID=UPI002E361147|nr:hypothetical protein [Actinacidiphila glaucinigra]